jgi:cytochrome c
MMGPSMSASSTINGNSSEIAARPLIEYIRKQRLNCFSCHAVSKRGRGPSFSEIAHRYAGDPNVEKTLTSSIARGVSRKWRGYGRMPGGLATPEQASELAHFIMRLSGSK